MNSSLAKSTTLACAVLLGAGLNAQTALSTDGSYDTTGIDQNTTAASAFNTTISNAWANDLGGAIDFDGLVSTDDEFTSTFGTNGTNTLAFSTSTTMQSATDSGTFLPLSGRAFLQTTDTNGWTLTFDSITGTPNLTVDEVGFTLLPRDSADYPLDVEIGDRTINFNMDDWMYLQPDGRLINRTAMKKFGLTLGEITLVFEQVD